MKVESGTEFGPLGIQMHRGNVCVVQGDIEANDGSYGSVVMTRHAALALAAALVKFVEGGEDE